MKRRSPVQSVLAERKMFAGGGMLPISTPMNNQPSGILASSEPLIDVVAQEVLAPMTGGPMPMNQGGVASLQYGGMPSARQLANRRAFTNSIRNIFGNVSDRFVSEDEDQEDPIRRFKPKTRKQVLAELIDKFSDVGIGSERTPTTVSEEVLKVSPVPIRRFEPKSIEQVKGQIIDKFSDVGIGSAPVTDPDKIKRTSSRIIPIDEVKNELTNITGPLKKSYEKSVKDNLNPDFVGAATEVEKEIDAFFNPDRTSMIPVRKRPYVNQEGGVAQGVIEADEVLLSKLGTEDDVQFFEGDTSAEAEEKIRTQDPMNPILSGVGEEAKAKAEAETDKAETEKAEKALAEAALKDYPAKVTDAKVTDAKVTDAKVTDAGLKLEEASQNAAVQQLKNITKTLSENTSEKEATKTIADYKKEFIDQMPEYQGMSEEEKGYALLEAGLRVAAGESPSAIANVAKGLQGLGATFAKDEKEKRVWDRQVNLSAAKYGIQSIQKDRQNQIALAAEGRKRPFELIATKDYVDQATGLTVKRGTAVPLTNQQITDGYLTKYPLTYRETFLSDAKALADLAEANKKDLLKPQNFTTDRETYIENARSVKNGIRMKELLLEAANIAIPDGTKDNQILGAVPLFKSWINKALNAAGYQMDTSEGREKLNSFRSNNKEEYTTLMKTIGTTMVTEILNETNRTISEGDRDRVDQLVAAYSDFDGTFASYRSLLTKLKNLERSIDSGIQNASNSMKGIEEQWGTAEFVGGGKAANVMQRIRQGVSAPGYSVGQTRSQAIPYRDIIDMKTRKFTPKYQSIFGKQS